MKTLRDLALCIVTVLSVAVLIALPAIVWLLAVEVKRLFYSYPP